MVVLKEEDEEDQKLLMLLQDRLRLLEDRQRERYMRREEVRKHLHFLDIRDRRLMREKEKAQSLDEPRQSIASASGVDCCEDANLTDHTSLEEVAEIASNAAVICLKDLLSPKWTEGMSTYLYDMVLYAFASMNTPLPPVAPSPPHIMGAQALIAIGKALQATSSARPRSQLWCRLTQVETHLRDSTLCQCLLRVDLSDRRGFDKELRDAFGKALEDELVFARLMHSHRIVTKGQHTFPSNSQWATVKYGKNRPKRTNREGNDRGLDHHEGAEYESVS